MVAVASWEADYAEGHGGRKQSKQREGRASKTKCLLCFDLEWRVRPTQLRIWEREGEDTENTVYYKHNGKQWQRRSELAQPSRISKSKGKHCRVLIKRVIFFSFQRYTSFAYKDMWTWELYHYCNKKTLNIFLWTGLFWLSNWGQTARLWGQRHWGSCRATL